MRTALVQRNAEIGSAVISAVRTGPVERTHVVRQWGIDRGGPWEEGGASDVIERGGASKTGANSNFFKEKETERKKSMLFFDLFRVEHFSRLLVCVEEWEEQYANDFTQLSPVPTSSPA